MQVLQRARGVENVEIELEDIVEAARQSRLVKNPYKTILQRKYRPQFLVACVFMIFQQFDVSPFACTDAIPFLSCMVKRPFKTTSCSARTAALFHCLCLHDLSAF